MLFYFDRKMCMFSSCKDKVNSYHRKPSASSSGSSKAKDIVTIPSAVYNKGWPVCWEDLY